MRSLYLISLVYAYLCLCTIFGPTVAEEEEYENNNNNDSSENSDGCHAVYNSEKTKSGSFNSTDFPEPYPRDENCTFKFQGKEKFLKLDFSKFNLRGGSNKNCSLVKGDLLRLTPESPSNVTLYCGKQDPFSITLNTSSVTIELVSSWKNFSNSNSKDVGFQANFEFTDKASSGLSSLSSGSNMHFVLTVLCLITSSSLGLQFF